MSAVCVLVIKLFLTWGEVMPKYLILVKKQNKNTTNLKNNSL